MRAMRAGLLLTLMVLACGVARAADPFRIDLATNGASGSRGFTSLEAAINTIDNAGFQSIVGAYTPTAAAIANVNLRGIAAIASFDANSPVLRVIVPGAGIDRSFAGATRDDSGRLFLRWLQGQGNDEVNRLLRYGVRSTGADPVAGNPASAMNQFVASDFNRSLAAATGERAGGFGLGVRFGSFTAGGFRTQALSVPLDYSWQLSPDDVLQVDAPFAWSDTEGARSYAGNIGVLWRRRMTENWTLQPSFRIGGVGSIDLGAGSGVWSVGLNSTLRLDLPAELRLTIANAISHVATIPFSIGRYQIDYNIGNTVFRNGLVLGRDLGIEVAGLALRGNVFVIDTRFTGDAVYIRSYQEFGAFVSVGQDNLGGVGVTFLTGARGARGLSFNMGVKF